eukprot:TRINITY_DN25941_c0_g1_i1.p1 TRINITY_DN25941_c0_g1~~TRINITY_DN25941_c0_g1_i1.p1  ORF type:complete len:761 (-),score=191.47 TRINITY_DN25941_c0_g1_i1:61-2343(-)
MFLSRFKYGAAFLLVAAAVRIGDDERGPAHDLERASKEGAILKSMSVNSIAKGAAPVFRGDHLHSLGLDQSAVQVEAAKGPIAAAEASIVKEAARAEEETLQAAPPAGSTGLMLVLAPAIVVIPAVLLFICYVICGEDDLNRNIATKKAEVETLGTSCNKLADEVKIRVEELVERQVDQCQHDFNYKKDDFVAFLDYCQMNADKMGSDSDLAEVHFAFVGHWLDIFRDCSAAPMTQPWNEIPRDQYGRSCPRGITATSKWVAQKLRGSSVDLFQLDKITGRRKSGYFTLRGTPDFASKQATRRHPPSCVMLPPWIDCCGANRSYEFTPYDEKPQHMQTGAFFPCEIMLCFHLFRLQFVSWLHFSVLLYWFLLMPAGIWVFRLPYFIGTSLIFLGWIMTTIVLGRMEKINVVSKLSTQKSILEEDKKLVEKAHKDVMAFYEQCDIVTRCWTMRTRPRLDIMKQLTRKLMDTPWHDSKACRDFYKAAVEGLRSLDRGVGALKFYCCPPGGQPGDMISHEAMLLLRKQLEKVASIIRNSDVKEVQKKAKDIMCIPNMLAVRVLGAQELPQGTWQARFEPYVRLRCKKEADWVRTDKRPREQNPRWHSDSDPVEFRFLVEGLGQELECAVLTESSGDGDDTLLGRTVVKIDHLACGKWTSMTNTLMQPILESQPGSLELEVMLARTAKDLSILLPVKGAEFMEPWFVPPDTRPPPPLTQQGRKLVETTDESLKHKRGEPAKPVKAEPRKAGKVEPPKQQSSGRF